LFLGRVGAHSKNAILALQPDLDARLEILRNEGGHADSKVDVESILDFPSRTAGNALTDVESDRFCRVRGRVFLREGYNFNTFWGCGFDDSVDVDSREMDRIGRDFTGRNDMLSLLDRT